MKELAELDPLLPDLAPELRRARTRNGDWQGFVEYVREILTGNEILLKERLTDALMYGPNAGPTPPLDACLPCEGIFYSGVTARLDWFGICTDLCLPELVPLPAVIAGARLFCGTC